MQQTAPLPRPVSAPWERPRAALGRLRERLADPVDRPLLLWRAFWAPFWAWSEAPRPELPRREGPAPDDLGLAGQAVATGIDRIRRRLWLSHAAAFICRGIWLGIVIGALMMLADVVGGPAFDPRPALIVGGLLLAAALVLAAASKPSRARTARMLDRSFGLHERLTTGLDDLGLAVPGPGERAPVVYLQMADAANALAILRNDRRLRPAIPVREVVLIVLAGLVLATLAFARGLGGGLPELAAAQVPAFTPAIERPVEPEPSAAEIEAATMAPTIQEVLERSDRSSRARRDLQQLAAALSDHAITRPAAEQIAQGDYAAAGEQLREAASETGNLSEGARAGLADDLDRAAATMEPETSGLHEATRDAATGLQLGDEPARNEMRDLANAVENAGEQVVPPGELASQMRNAQQSQPQAQAGQSEGQASAAATEGESGAASSQTAASGDPGRGADASASTSSEAAEQSGSQESQPGSSQSGSDDSQPPGGGEQGQGNAPGEGEQPGAGENGAPGNASQGEGDGGEPGSEAGADAETANAGGGAGTGEGQEAEAQGASAEEGVQVASGEEPADPNVSGGDGAEGEPAPLDGANQRIALPAGSGQQGIQTSSDGGSALRGSGAGVTAGSGVAVQGEVGDAGPDSNRVPPRHRDTVERYFSAGGDE